MDERQKESEWKSDVLLNLRQVQGLVYQTVAPANYICAVSYLVP